MKKNYRRAKPYRRRTKLSATKWGPLLSLGAVVFGVLALIALFIFIVLPRVLPLIGMDYKAPFAPTPTPTPTVRPTPTPHPIETANIESMQQEVVFQGSSEYTWFADPYVYDDTLIFTAGQLVDNRVNMLAMMYFDPETREVTNAGAPLENSHYMFPAFNDDYLVYLDANYSGGGLIKVVDRKASESTAKTLKTVYSGQPVLYLYDHYLCWTERTGTRMDKLFVADLATFETTTLQMFSGSTYGQSLPFMRDGLIVWADADGNSGDESKAAIHSIKLTDSTISTYVTDTYVHDPKFTDGYFVWMDSNHAPENKLYCGKLNQSPKLIAEGVVDFGVGDDFITFSLNEQLWLYFMDSGKYYQLTPERERAQLCGVSDNHVMWMDVTSRERDILKLAKIY